MLQPLYAILLDGAFLTKRLYSKLGRHVTADDIVAECDRLRNLRLVRDYELLRIYFYDAAPSSERVTLPISRTPHELGATERYRLSVRLHAQLVLKPHFALRLGHVILSPYRWKLKPGVLKRLIRYQLDLRNEAGELPEEQPLADSDFLLDISQKGVDMRIGMDMARLALREMVRTIIVVTADSDFIPAFKFVRREGVKVILEPMGANPHPELRAHADIVL